MDLNLYTVERAGYNILDLLSNVGGILALLMTFFSDILTVFNYKNFDNIMASQFYKLKVHKGR